MPEPVPVFTGTVSNPYPSYTQCVQPGDYNSQSQYMQAFLAALLAGSVAAAIVAALGPEFWCFTLAVLLGAIAGGLAYCNWWLNDRLICLPVDTNPADPTYLAPIANGPAVDVCAVGMYITPPDGGPPQPWAREGSHDARRRIDGTPIINVPRSGGSHTRSEVHQIPAVQCWRREVGFGHALGRRAGVVRRR